MFKGAKACLNSSDGVMLLTAQCASMFQCCSLLCILCYKDLLSQSIKTTTWKTELILALFMKLSLFQIYTTSYSFIQIAIAGTLIHQ